MSSALRVPTAVRIRLQSCGAFLTRQNQQVFLTNDTSGHSIVNNVCGDQHVVYGLNAT